VVDGLRSHGVCAGTIGTAIPYPNKSGLHP
jgi:hypothetical protein